MQLAPPALALPSARLSSANYRRQTEASRVRFSLASRSTRVASWCRNPCQPFPFAQRKLRRVVSIRVQQVEKIVIDHDATSSRLFRITQLHASLQAREARDVSFEGHDFAIDDEIINRLLCERLGQLRIGIVDPLLIARHQTHHL